MQSNWPYYYLQNRRPSRGKGSATAVYSLICTVQIVHFCAVYLSDQLICFSAILLQEEVGRVCLCQGKTIG